MQERFNRLFGRRTGNIDLGRSEHTSEFATFSPEQRRGLERSGYVLHQLTGQSIATLRDAGNSFWNSWHKGKAFENEPSMRTEVAINPRALFLPNSDRKTLAKQLAMVSRFSEKIRKDIPGVTAKLGGVSDYAELAFAHERVSGVRLFGRDYDYHFTRTTTSAGGSVVALVGRFYDDGLGVSDWRRDRGLRGVWAAPLVVPESVR